MVANTKMSNTYITSDTHFGHLNICGPTLSNWKSGFRNFSSLDEMENVIVDNINMVVGKDDTLIHVGDVFMGQVEKHAERIRKRINCQKIQLVYGNHDKKIRKSKELQSLFSSCQDYLELYHNGNFAVIQHYPLSIWNKNGSGSVMLYGHCHGSYQNDGRSIDVGVDCWNFKPIQLDFAISEAMKRPIVVKDHHGEETSYA